MLQSVALVLRLSKKPWHYAGRLLSVSSHDVSLGVILTHQVREHPTRLAAVFSSLPFHLFQWFEFGVVFQASVFFYYFCVPETRGKSLEQIADDLAAEFRLPKDHHAWNT